MLRIISLQPETSPRKEPKPSDYPDCVSPEFFESARACSAPLPRLREFSQYVNIETTRLGYLRDIKNNKSTSHFVNSEFDVF